MNLAFIIKKPIITEKTMNNAKSGVFTFVVSNLASKNQIAMAIESAYSVDVLHVRTSTIHGKSYRVGRTRIVKKRPNTKKAYIQLKSGQKIDLFDIKDSE